MPLTYLNCLPTLPTYLSVYQLNLTYIYLYAWTIISAHYPRTYLPYCCTLPSLFLPLPYSHHLLQNLPSINPSILVCVFCCFLIVFRHYLPSLLPFFPLLIPFLYTLPLLLSSPTSHIPIISHPYPVHFLSVNFHLPCICIINGMHLYSPAFLTFLSLLPLFFLSTSYPSLSLPKSRRYESLFPSLPAYLTLPYLHYLLCYLPSIIYTLCLGLPPKCASFPPSTPLASIISLRFLPSIHYFPSFLPFFP